MGKYLFIINPNAGKKAGGKKLKQMFEALKKTSVAFEVVYTKQAGHATELSENADLDIFDVVVAVGGDGTVNEVAAGLKGRNVLMGIIPMGSGNGLARDLKISTKIKKAVDIVVQKKGKKVDLWQMNDRIFLCVAGLGFDAEVARKMALAKGRGKWQYVLLTLKESINYKPVEIDLNIGSQNLKQSVFLSSFANSGQFGNNAYIAPGAKINDGLLDVAVIRPVPKIAYPLLGISLFLKIIHKFKFVTIYRTDSVRINNASSGIFHIDGESIEVEYPVQISLLEENVRVCVP